MASPELPDDRRDSPRRSGPTDPAEPRGASVGERIPGHVPGTGPNGAPFPGYPVANGRPAPNGAADPADAEPPGSVPSRPSQGQLPPAANGFRLFEPQLNGATPPRAEGGPSGPYPAQGGPSGHYPARPGDAAGPSAAARPGDGPDPRAARPAERGGPNGVRPGDGQVGPAGGPARPGEAPGGPIRPGDAAPGGPSGPYPARPRDPQGGPVRPGGQPGGPSGAYPARPGDQPGGPSGPYPARPGAPQRNGSGRPGGPQPGGPSGPYPARPGAPQGPGTPRRGPVEPDDRPTDIVPPLPDSLEPQRRVDPAAVDPEGAPGRHRRRAGASADSHPASDYVPKRGPGGRKPKSGRRRRSTFWKELPILIGVALVLTILIQAFVAKVYVIPSGSMETTLHGCNGCNNDRVLVDKVTYRFGDPQPGDVVVFRGPDSWVNTEFTVSEPSGTFGEVVQQFLSLIGLAPPDEKDFVKRVIAVGGQTVSCCDSRNRVMVDGQPLDEPYVYYLPEAGPPRQIPFGPITVPAGELWVMGDSRNNSSDSRIDGHGPIPVANVIGKARLIVLPISRFGWIDSTNPQTTAALGAPVGLAAVGFLPLLLLRRRRLDREDDEFLPRRR